MKAAEYIRHLNLTRHPEGGYYKETYRSKDSIPADESADRFPANRSYSTAIFFLLQAGDFSAFHRIKSDECWHFYAGGPLLIHLLETDGNHYHVTLGNDLKQQQSLQFIVPANTWFASEPASATDFALVGCTVAPGFDFQDFEMADSLALNKEFPQHSGIINRLCR